jgi:hypothetical protein
VFAEPHNILKMEELLCKLLNVYGVNYVGREEYMYLSHYFLKLLLEVEIAFESVKYKSGGVKFRENRPR